MNPRHEHRLERLTADYIRAANRRETPGQLRASDRVPFSTHRAHTAPRYTCPVRRARARVLVDLAIYATTTTGAIAALLALAFGIR